MEQSEILETYYGRDAKKLRGTVDKILVRFGGISEKDEDDFYSLANEVFVDVLRRYDGGQSFHAFLYACLLKRMKSEMTRRNREKRRLDREAVSIELPVGDGEDTIGNLIPAEFDMEREVERYHGFEWNENINQYLLELSLLQRKILAFRMEGYTGNEIMERLGISECVYHRNLEQIRSREKTRILFADEPGSEIKGDRNKGESREMSDNRINYGNTLEISKETMYAVSSIIKKTANGFIRDDHPLQRDAGQWSHKTKGELIVTILQRYPIPSIIIAEQMMEGFTVNWLIDGKQRCTTCCEFAAGDFKISKNVERPIVAYQSMKRDPDGAVVYENRQCDVRGMQFRDLPEELKERFLDYTIPVVLYLDCSDDDIEYHIRRYNAAKPMSASQKGITHLGDTFAGCVKAIAAKPFFKDIGNYRICEFLNGTINRVVTESVMTMFFLPDWKKKNEDICEYLKKNADIRKFEEFGENVDRLTKVVNKETAQMFNSRDSFLWFGLYGRFKKTGEPDAEFIAFMEEFKKSLHAKEIYHMTYDGLNAKATKDKSTVTKKLELLEGLMEEYLRGKGSRRTA